MQNRQNRHLVKRIIFHWKNHPRMIAGIILSTRMIVLVVYYRRAFGRLLDVFGALFGCLLDPGTSLGRIFANL